MPQIGHKSGGEQMGKPLVQRRQCGYWCCPADLDTQTRLAACGRRSWPSAPGRHGCTCGPAPRRSACGGCEASPRFPTPGRYARPASAPVRSKRCSRHRPRSVIPAARRAHGAFLVPVAISPFTAFEEPRLRRTIRESQRSSPDDKALRTENLRNLWFLRAETSGACGFCRDRVGSLYRGAAGLRFLRAGRSAGGGRRPSARCTRVLQPTQGGATR